MHKKTLIAGVRVKGGSRKQIRAGEGRRLSMLRTVWYKIEENRTARSEQIFRALAEKGIPCRKPEQEAQAAGGRTEIRQGRNKKRCPGAGRKAKKGTGIIEPTDAECWKETGNLCHMLLLTDDRALAGEASGCGIACIGVAGADAAFFDGADMVVEDPLELELRELEEYLCHCHGIPVTIAQTKRLILREMVADDWQVLDRISRQRGMEKARRDAEEDGAFGKERLASYVGSQYRLYGYGLWAVLLTKEYGRHNGKNAVCGSGKFQKSSGKQNASVIGCCGFSELEYSLHCVEKVQSEQSEDGTPCEKPVHCRESGFRNCLEFSGPVLELQYMLDEAYRRQGYGTEMCRAAITYAYEYLEAKEIWVRVRSDYPEALSFARSLGFRPAEREVKNNVMDAGKIRTGSSEVCAAEMRADQNTVRGEVRAFETADDPACEEPWQIVWLRHEPPHF